VGTFCAERVNGVVRVLSLRQAVTALKGTEEGTAHSVEGVSFRLTAFKKGTVVFDGTCRKLVQHPAALPANFDEQAELAEASGVVVYEVGGHVELAPGFAG